MRLVRGPSLGKRLEVDGRIPWEETVAILDQVSDALAYAHEQGVIHRDIKPRNILLDERSGAMLSDFGLARLVGTSALTQSLSGGIVGTPSYIAPEIWEGKEATPATDVYALACVTYEMLTGETLFEGPTPMAVMRLHDQGARLPEEWPIDVPPDIREVLARAAAREPEARFASVAAFVAALSQLQTAAVRERIAAEVGRQRDGMREALAAGRFAEAAGAGERLLDLQADHTEGARLLGEAQAQLARQQELAARMEQALASIEAERSTFEAEHAQLIQQRDALAAQIEAIAAELAEAERRMVDLRDSRLRLGDALADAQARLQEQEAQVSSLDARSRRLDEARGHIEGGRLQEADHVLTHPTRTGEAPASPIEPTGGPAAQRQRTLHTPARAPDTDHSVTATPPRSAWWWAIAVVGLITLLFGSVQLGSEPGLGVFLFILGGAMAWVGTARAT